MSDRESTQSTDDHTPHRPLRIPDEEWKPFGELAGERNRTKVIRQFIRWYNGNRGAQLPQPPAE
ncbi:hypothetical protein ACFXKD_27665 [Nocardiopsis aegyptia]|uniref:hypothetical protein n=1 Tax=Nocardiopsis aegyptia TaxID=220378 RepID=UPI00366C4C7B